MFKLDKEIFKFIYDFCKMTGEGFGYGIKEGFFINLTLITGTILIALNNKGAKEK